MPASADLRRQIDDLALHLVLGESSETTGGSSLTEWIRALESICQGALGEGAGRVADTARALIESLCTSGASDLAALQNGIAGLQEAMENRPAPKAEASLGDDPELLTDFVVESNEHLASIESQLLILERDPANAEALHSIFRNFHTMKGLAGFLELWEIQTLAHEVEAVLDQARSLSFALTPAAIETRLETSPVTVTDPKNGRSFPRIDCSYSAVAALRGLAEMVEKEKVPIR